MSIKEQFNTMHRFRRGEINCLFATQVAEEGIDIPDCDLIVRFDLYDSPIQYIQSKGRARRANSTYISMLEENNMQHFRRLKEATLNASALRRFVSVLSQDRKVTDQDLDTDQRAQDMELESKSQRIFKIPETEAQMTYYSSQQVLAKFVSSLPDGDGLHPEYIVTPTYKGSNYIATLILPDSSPVKTLRGTPQRSKTLARASAAFEACIDMFYRGYIDGHLQSTLKKRLPAMRNARLGLSSSKRSEYTMRLKPDVWSQTGAPAELYVAVFTMDGSALPGKTGRSLLVLTRSKLPALAPITLHVGTTERRTVKPVQYDQSTAVGASEVALIAGFTFTIFKDVFSKEFDCKGENLPYYFAPCSNRDASDVKVDTRRLIDWALLESMAQVNETMPTPGWQITDELAHKFVYDPLDGSRKFITGAVNEHLRPSDRVPAGAPPPKSRGFFRVAGTIADYSNSLSFNARRRVTWDPEQPVYHAELLPIRRNLLCQPEDDETAGCKSCSIILEPMVVSAASH
ncbi:hypothetical protein UVI_02056110 [Ustilaginoidea virens]|uniref:Dicer-like protein 1 n=1 Tax=Ustilaginoidea virens TaxID=1159556 RepID=A0A1B5L3F7_USTVR|nr:hypothetical protein UVI_02056110 [Ustilaginoidea virens]